MTTNITIAREEYDTLRNLVYSIDGLYNLLNRHGGEIDVCHIAAILRPINKEITHLYEAVHDRVPSEGEGFEIMTVGSERAPVILDDILSSDDEDAKQAVLYLLSVFERSRKASQ